MAGELYKALSRNQNLEPAIDNIRNAVREKRNREVMNRLVDTMRNVDNMSATPSLNYEPDPMQRYKNAGNLVNKALFDELAAGADPNALQNIGGSMMNKVNMMRPEEQQFFQADPFKELYYGKNLLRGAKEKAAKAIPFNQTKEGIDYKNQKDIEKIGAEGKEARKTAGYKDSLDDKNSNNQTQLDRSKLRGQISKGISEINNIKKFGYNEQTMDEGGLNAMSPYYQVIDNKGKKIKLNSKEDVTNYKETVKSQYAQQAQELITKAGLDDAIGIIRKGIQNGLKPDEAFNQFKQANSGNISEDDIQDLQNWFTLFGL